MFGDCHHFLGRADRRMITITPRPLMVSFSVIILMMGIIALPKVSGTDEVAEMQLNFWRKKLPSVQVPETVTASMSPLTQEEVNTFSKIMKDGNLRFHATEFCESSNLLCDQSVHLITPQVTAFARQPHMELDDTNNIFFSPQQLREGGQIILPDLSSPWKAFLPRNLSQLMPFSTEALLEILSSFDILETSNMAMNMNMTLNACQSKPQEGEIKTCTTSIEGMIEFVLSNLGSSSDNIELVFHPSRTADSGKKATVRKVSGRLSGPSNRAPLACHRFVYPYGVFYCHSINGTSTFTMELQVSENNDNFYNTVTALCHPSGKGKESEHCHLFLGDSLLWLIKDY